MLKRMSQRPEWCKFIAALVICAPIACSEQILPQLVAQIASLDRDHGVSLHANGDGIDLILTHKHHASPQNDEGLGLMLSASEPAHVVHIATGSTSPKQSPLLAVSNTPDVVPFLSTTVASVWRTFVPPPPLAYSRPPPVETSICPLDSSAVLLI
jgi:hypothetical protein